MLKEWYAKFSAQPHQPFFTNGIILLTLFMGILYLNYSQILELTVSLQVFHAYAFIFMIFTQFFMGFLFVVFPRFLMQSEIPSAEFMRYFYAYFIASILLLLGVLFATSLYFVASVILFITQVLTFKLLYTMYKKSLMKDKYDTKWVIIGLLSGVVAHGLYLISLLDIPQAFVIERLAINSGFYLFLFVIIFAISQRMIPFFTSMKVAGYTINKSKKLMEKVYALLLLKVLLLTFTPTSYHLLADIPLLILFVYELYRWKLPLFKVSAIMWVLFISLYWIPVGFFLGSLESISALLGSNIVFEKASLHAFAVGYFLTVLIGFGTRVTLGHSGQTPHANKITTAMFIFIQLIVVIRLWASFSLNFESDYIFWIKHSAILLVIALVAWSVKYLTILIKGHKPSH